MRTTLPDLSKAITQKDYHKIALLSHSIKGSSGNFRLESLQKIASSMEMNAKESKEDYDYVRSYLRIKEKIESIRVI
jgi:HPt (histidine-containing phosphotransfer) domain-containing protein